MLRFSDILFADLRIRNDLVYILNRTDHGHISASEFAAVSKNKHLLGCFEYRSLHLHLWCCDGCQTHIKIDTVYSDKSFIYMKFFHILNGCISHRRCQMTVHMTADHIQFYMSYCCKFISYQERIRHNRCYQIKNNLHEFYLSHNQHDDSHKSNRCSQNICQKTCQFRIGML